MRMILLLSMFTTAWSGAFVHLFEWSWSDVALECEQYLGPHNFSAVQVSPPQEDIQGVQWWTRYQPVSYNLTSRSGARALLADAVHRCKAVGVDIYVDAVINHMAAGSGTGVDGTTYGNRNFAGSYSQSDFHHNPNDETTNCKVTFTSRDNIQRCDLLGLPDLDQSLPHVQDRLKQYLTSLKAIGVAGVRVDAAKHISADQLRAVVEPTGLFAFCEVDQDQYVKGAEYYDFCKVTEFGVGRDVGGNFKQGNMQDLSTFGTGSWGLQPSDNVVTFIDNHDTQRSGTPLTYKQGALYRLATIFLLAHPYGYPKVMSSYYFSDKDQGPPSVPVHSGTKLNCEDGKNWVCEHRWKGIGAMAAFRAACDSTGVKNLVAPTKDRIAFARAPNSGSAKGFVALNRASDSWQATFQTGLPSGNYKDLITGNTIVIASNGATQLNVPPQDAVAFGDFPNPPMV